MFKLFVGSMQRKIGSVKIPLNLRAAFREFCDIFPSDVSLQSTGQTDFKMEPYHDIVSSVFDHNVEEIEQLLITAARVRLLNLCKSLSHYENHNRIMQIIIVLCKS